MYFPFVNILPIAMLIMYPPIYATLVKVSPFVFIMGLFTHWNFPSSDRKYLRSEIKRMETLPRSK